MATKGLFAIEVSGTHRHCQRAGRPPGETAGPPTLLARGVCPQVLRDGAGHVCDPGPDAGQRVRALQGGRVESAESEIQNLEDRELSRPIDSGALRGAARVGDMASVGPRPRRDLRGDHELRRRGHQRALREVSPSRYDAHAGARLSAATGRQRLCAAVARVVDESAEAMTTRRET
jgi:hypothetical protein